ncbi:MAG TPA: helix-turn-helix transcriptional regulator [Trichocoleus sp.]
MSTQEKKGRLSDLLREFRARHGLSSRALARRIGLNPTSLSAYLDGISYPSPDTREKIAKAIGMTPNELESYLDSVPIKPLQGVEQIKQDIKALNRAEFLEVAESVLERLLSDAKSVL